MGFFLFQCQLGNIDIGSVLIRLIFLEEFHDLESRPFDRVANFQKLGRLFQVDRVDPVGVPYPRGENEAERLLHRRFEFQFRVIFGVRIAIGRVGVTLPFLEVAETIIVRILLKHIGISDRQSKLLQPFIWHGRMHFGRLQSRRKSICANEVLFRHKQPRATAKRPLGRSMQFLGHGLQFLRCRQRRYAF